LGTKKTSFLCEELGLREVYLAHDSKAIEGNIGVPQRAQHMHPLLALPYDLRLNSIVCRRTRRIAAGSDANLESTFLFAADDTGGLATQHAAVTEPITFRNVFDAVTRLMHSHITAVTKNNLIVVQALAAGANTANLIIFCAFFGSETKLHCMLQLPANEDSLNTFLVYK